MKNGFTLVELSIALVVIGLLIGGILVGQSLTNAAKISSTISQIGLYDAAIGGFVVKYKYLPGDGPGFGGNGDGLIGRRSAWGHCVGGTQDTANLMSGEILNFWHQIFPGKYVATNYVSTIHRSGLDTRVPSTKLGIKGGFFMASAATVSSGSPPWCIDNVARENYYIMVSPYNYPSYNLEPYNGINLSVLHTVLPGDRTVTVSDMLALDQKIDDAMPSTGNVIAGSFMAWNSGPSKVSLATCSSGSTYLINNTGYQCTPLIRMGTLGGNKK